MSEAAISAKSEIVSQIKDKLSRAKSVVIVDYRGLTVSEVTELRNNMRAAGVSDAAERIAGLVLKLADRHAGRRAK